ncbi:hypothetical protein [Neobacillus soli]|uniref:hypothetical protein n=1 Tax=Neobacillus soli TaxID=220688 RepID=UPI000A7BFF9F|nr:hypothetical protein [Neobacillus soli]
MGHLLFVVGMIINDRYARYTLLNLIVVLSRISILLIHQSGYLFAHYYRYIRNSCHT